jgi:hypothetical protein
MKVIASLISYIFPARANKDEMDIFRDILNNEVLAICSLLTDNGNE